MGKQIKKRKRERWQEREGEGDRRRETEREREKRGEDWGTRRYYLGSSDNEMEVNSADGMKTGRYEGIYL